MARYVKLGKKFKVTNKDELNIYDELPCATYTVKVVENDFFLSKIDPLDTSKKVYGDTLSTAERIFKTFKFRQGPTGALLHGEKGSGKTLIAKLISGMAAAEGISTIVINQPLCGEAFNEFIQSIDSPAIVVFDEFEKVYYGRHDDSQQKLLTLLDGVYDSKKLFLLTCNDISGLNVNLMNRPGRLFYAIECNGVDDLFIREYCQDKLINQEYTSMVPKVAKYFPTFNFDMLQALVDEMNRYDESPIKSLRFLNADPKFSNKRHYRLKLWIKDKMINLDEYGADSWRGNPFIDLIQVRWGHNREDVEQFNPNHISSTEKERGEIILVNDENGARLGMKRIDEWGGFNFDSLLEEEGTQEGRNERK